MSAHERTDGSHERTLVLVKPDGYRRGLTGEVLRRIESKGYKLVGLKVQQASEELLQEHYHEHRHRHFYPALIEFMSSGPLVAAVVEGTRVVDGVRRLIGSTDPTDAEPGTIRGDLGRAWGRATAENIVHGSDSPHSAQREIVLWFPELAEDAMHA